MIKKLFFLLAMAVISLTMLPGCSGNAGMEANDQMFPHSYMYDRDGNLLKAD
jgi:hypothetical protein